MRGGELERLERDVRWMKGYSAIVTDTVGELRLEFLRWSDGDVTGYPALDESTLGQLLSATRLSSPSR